ncbi:hypothetical protein [Nocardia heshunensis]
MRSVSGRGCVISVGSGGSVSGMVDVARVLGVLCVVAVSCVVVVSGVRFGGHFLVPLNCFRALRKIKLIPPRGICKMAVGDLGHPLGTGFGSR